MGWHVWLLAALVTSYFYALPLGRYRAFGVMTDLRLYDLASLAVLLLIVLPERHRLGRLWTLRTGFWRWSGILLAAVCVSLILTGATGGAAQLAPAVMRAFRFSVYLLTGSLLAIYANTPRRFRFLLAVFVLNVAFQACLAFLQGLGLVPHLWPDYWLTSYGKLPVGTLSPHHKQIGVVMLLGIATCLALVRHYRGFATRIALSGAAFVMFLVPVFGGTRTFALGAVGLVAGYLLQQKGGGTVRLMAFAAVVALGLVAAWGELQQPIEDQLDARVFAPIEKRGYEGIYGSRTQIYFEDLPRSAKQAPWILVTGTGFQNLRTFTHATGAHNNYLHVLFELGIFGFVIYMKFLSRTLATLRMTAKWTADPLAKSVAEGAWVAFVAVLTTMLVGESLWAQRSMLTLSGQILALVGIASAPLLWPTPSGPAQPRHLEGAAAPPGPAHSTR